jgi:hypothetical protein
MLLLVQQSSTSCFPHHVYFMTAQQSKAGILYILEYVQVDDHCYYGYYRIPADVEITKF